MKEIIDNEIKRIRLERKHMLIKAIGVFVFVSLASIYLLDLTPDIAGVAGFAVYDTQEQEYNVSGTSGPISFEQMPDFTMSVGNNFKYQIEGVSGEGMFYDDTRMFNITQEGLIEFEAGEENVGRHNVWIIYKNGKEYHYQNVVFEIEE